jgi:hypothetical protein
MSVERKIKKETMKVTFKLNGNKYIYELFPREVVHSVDDWIDKKKKVLVLFKNEDAYEDHMIESGNFSDLWAEDMSEFVADTLVDMGGRWEVDQEEMNAKHRYIAPREKVYYLPKCYEIYLASMLYYKWLIPVKKVEKVESEEK